MAIIICEHIDSYHVCFYTQCICIARIMPWQDVCPSVRLSVHLSHAGKRLYISSKFLHHPVVSFSVPNRMSIFRRGPPNGAPNARGYEKITICDQYRALSRNWCKIELAPNLSNGTILNESEWPLTQISRSWYYSTSNNSKTVPERVYFYLQWRTNWKLCMLYQTAPFSVALNDP